MVNITTLSAKHFVNALLPFYAHNNSERKTILYSHFRDEGSEVHKG